MKEFGEKRITELYGNKSLGDEDDQDSQTSGGDWGREGCQV